MRTDRVIEVLEVRTVDPEEVLAPAGRPSGPAQVEPVTLGRTGRVVADEQRRLAR